LVISKRPLNASDLPGDYRMSSRPIVADVYREQGRAVSICSAD
jgi:hypothetical protein